MSIEPMWDFVETLDHYQLDLLEYAINVHMARHLERGRTEEQCRERWADLLMYFVKSQDDLRQRKQSHG